MDRFLPNGRGDCLFSNSLHCAFSGSLGEAEVRSLVRGKGGLNAYLGTNSAMEVEATINRGNAKAREIYQAMAYQIAKEVGAMAAVLSGQVDAVVFTGGLAASAMLIAWIADRVKFLGPVIVYPGENEMDALALGALRVVRGEAAAAEY